MAHVLFVCLHNAGRSQMSQALFQQAAGFRHEARSAGSQADPSGSVHPEVVEVMRELGFDLSGREPHQLLVDTAGEGRKTASAMIAVVSRVVPPDTADGTHRGGQSSGPTLPQRRGVPDLLERSRPRAQACAAGLRTRPVAETLTDIRVWDATRPPGERSAPLPRRREIELLGAL